MSTIKLPSSYKTKGKTHPANTPVTVSAAEAKRLVARHGDVILVKGKTPNPKKGGGGGGETKPTGDNLIEAIALAIPKLDKDNSEHFTAAGIPDVAALEGVLGYDITAGERDAAWELAKD